MRGVAALVLCSCACGEGLEPGPDAGPADLGPTCETLTLPAPRVLSSTSGVEFSFPRLDPRTAALHALEISEREPRDVVVVDDDGRILRRLGLGSALRTVPLDFGLTQHAPWILISGRDGLFRRGLEDELVRALLPGRLGIEPELSPDGRTLVFRENTRLFRVLLTEDGEVGAGPEEIMLTQSVGAMRPRFSPSGDRLAYFMGGVIESYELATGTRRVLAAAVGQAHVAWLDAERLVIADDRGISILRGDCVVAARHDGPARQVDTWPQDGRVVYKPLGSADLAIIEGASR